MRYRSLLFDLDGTLIDSRDDLFRGRTELEKAGADYLIEQFGELLGIVDGTIKI
jgi:phosphoglycolate phosphatase-like HAD superfamily hydrolase